MTDCNKLPEKKRISLTTSGKENNVENNFIIHGEKKNETSFDNDI